MVLLTWAGGFVNLTKLGGCGGDAISKIGADINDTTITIKAYITHSVNNAYYASTTPISGNICSSAIAFSSSSAPGYSINI